MTQNEIQFLDYFYTEYVVKRNQSDQMTNTAYELLKGQGPITKCNRCIKERLTELKTRYVILSKLHKPTLLVAETPKSEPRTIKTTKKTRKKK